MLKSLPELPPSLAELEAVSDLSMYDSLAQLPALPEGLTRLNISGCRALKEVSSGSRTTLMQNAWHTAVLQPVAVAVQVFVAQTQSKPCSGFS